MKIFYKTILRFKLALGLLVLMIRPGSKANAQNDTLSFSCYISITKITPQRSVQTVGLGVQTGIDHKTQQLNLFLPRVRPVGRFSAEYGLMFNYSQEGLAFGPYVRITPPTYKCFYFSTYSSGSYAIKPFIETGAQIPVSKSASENIFVSYGLMFRPNMNYNISLFSGLQSNTEIAKGYYYTVGITFRKTFYTSAKKD